MPAYNYCSLLRNPVCILLALPFGSIFFMIFVSLHFSVIFFYSLFTVLYWMTEYCLWNIVFFFHAWLMCLCIYLWFSILDLLVLYWTTEYCLWKFVFHVDCRIFAFICDYPFSIYVMCIGGLNIAYWMTICFSFTIDVSSYSFLICNCIDCFGRLLVTEWNDVFHSQLLFLCIY